MKNMKKQIFFQLLFITICMVLPMLTFAQGPPDPQDTPIDGGIGLLLAAGVGYGVKKYRDSRKKAEEDFCPNL